MPERVVTIVPKDGLHARPASKFVDAAGSFDADVRVGLPDGDLVNATSILSITGLEIEQGDEVRLVAEGEEATAALDELEQILTSTKDEL